MVDILLLEDRILLSASPVGVTPETIDGNSTTPTGEPFTDANVFADEIIDSDLNDVLDHEWHDSESLVFGLEHSKLLTLKLLLIETGIEQNGLLEDLSDSSDSEVEMVLLNHMLDGNAEVTHVLEQIDAVGGLDYPIARTTSTEPPIYSATDVGPTAIRAEATIATASNNTAPHDLLLSNSTIAENDLGAQIGLVTVLDDDAGDTHTFAVDDTRFEILPSGLLQLNDGVALDFEGENPINIGITATDEGGESIFESFAVFTTDTNDPPVAIAISTDTVSEGVDTTNGHDVGMLTTLDADSNESFTYSIVGGEEAALFAIDGQTLVLSDDVIDFERKESYEVILNSTDSGGASVEQLFNIFVVDINEAPEIVNATNEFSIDENELFVGMLNAVDPDADPLTFSLAGGPDGAEFEILQTGELLFRNAPDFELPTDADGDGVYVVDVEVTDGIFKDVERFSVAVLPTNDNAPIIVSAPFFSVESGKSFVGTIEATDADLPADSLTYKIAGGFHANLFTMDGNQLMFKVPQIHGNSNFRQVFVQADDGEGGVARQMVIVRVDNTAPVAVDDSFATSNFEPVAGNVLQGDTDIDDSELVASLVTPPSSGSLALNSDGSFVFVPAADIEGTIQFEYRVTDQSGNSDTAIVGISVSKTGGPVATGSNGTPPSSNSSDNSTSPNQTDGQSNNQPTLPPGIGPEAKTQPQERNAVFTAISGLAGESEPDLDFAATVTTLDVATTKSTNQVDLGERFVTLISQDTNWHTDADGAVLFVESTLSDAYSIEFGSFADGIDATFELSGQVTGTVLSASVVTVSGVILGYLFWIIQSGIALSNIVTQLPMWNSFDPLPVLQFANESDDTEESLDDLLLSQGDNQQTLT